MLQGRSTPDLSWLARSPLVCLQSTSLVYVYYVNLHMEIRVA